MWAQRSSADVGQMSQALRSLVLGHGSNQRRGLAATAQAQAEAAKEAQRAGIAHAKANGDARLYKGRKPSYSRKQFENAQAELGKSASVGEVARALGLTRQTVYRIKDDAAAAEAALATWGI